MGASCNAYRPIPPSINVTCMDLELSFDQTSIFRCLTLMYVAYPCAYNCCLSLKVCGMLSSLPMQTYDFAATLLGAGTVTPPSRPTPPVLAIVVVAAAFFACSCNCTLACATAASRCTRVPPAGPAPFVAATFNSFRNLSIRIASDEKPGMWMLYSRPRWN